MSIRAFGGGVPTPAAFMAAYVVFISWLRPAMLQSVAIVLAVAIVFLDVNALAPLFESGPVSARPTYAEFCVPGLVEKGHYEAEIRINIHNQSDEPVTFDRWSARQR